MTSKYLSPECVVIEGAEDDVICQSADVNVSNPFDATEEEW